MNCTMGYYWHSLLGGGIYQHDDKWYRNCEFNYKPPEKEIAREEPGDIQQEDLEIPQGRPQKAVTGTVERSRSTPSQQTSA